MHRPAQKASSGFDPPSEATFRIHKPLHALPIHPHAPPQTAPTRLQNDQPFFLKRGRHVGAALVLRTDLLRCIPSALLGVSFMAPAPLLPNSSTANTHPVEGTAQQRPGLACALVDVNWYALIRVYCSAWPWYGHELLRVPYENLSPWDRVCRCKYQPAGCVCVCLYRHLQTCVLSWPRRAVGSSVCVRCYTQKKEQAQQHPGTNTKRAQ